MKIRIVERRASVGGKLYVIQVYKKRWLRSRWIDGSDVYCSYFFPSLVSSPTCIFGTYDEAIENIGYFDGSQCTDKQIFIKEC